MDGVIFRGESPTFDISNLSAGNHSLHFFAYDSLNFSSNVYISSIRVNIIPEIIEIVISPKISVKNDSITFRCIASDDNQIHRYSWASDIDGVLYFDSFNNFTLDDLSYGNHTITVKVQDSDGYWSDIKKTSIIVHYRPSAIIVSISPNPALETVPIAFTANGTDDGEIVRYVWKKGETELFNGTDIEFFKSDLTLGVHTISLRVQDNNGVWSEEVSLDLEILADTDGDGIADNYDAFPDDPAASKDTDGDGYPDEWNNGKTEKDSTSGLKLDEYPSDSKKWEKDDGGGGGLIPGFEVVILVLSLALVLSVKRRK